MSWMSKSGQLGMSWLGAIVELPDCMCFLVYGRLLSYAVRISPRDHSLREADRAERPTATHGASKPIATDRTGADGSAEGR